MMFPWYSLVIVWVAFWHHPLVTLWLGPENGGQVAQIFPYVVAGCCLNAMANISGAQLGALNRIGLGWILSTFTALSSASLVLLGWHISGLQGAGIGYLVGRVPLVIQDLVVRRITGLRLSDSLFWFSRKIFIQVLTMCAGFALARLFNANLSVQLAMALASGAALAILEMKSLMGSLAIKLFPTGR